MSETTLFDRTALPDALRVLVREIPRDHWEAHPDFGGTVQFWMQRHLMFRDLLGLLQRETQAVLDSATAVDVYGRRLSRFAGIFFNELHGHHHIEDVHYFPQLIRLDNRVERAFEILDADHKALDGLLEQFATGANAVLGAEEGVMRDVAGAFHDDLVRLHGFLDRHLVDEEEIIVPVILKSGFEG